MPANILFDIEFSEAAPAVLADPTQIYQVVLNLATNALHAMEDHGGLLTLPLDSFLPDEQFMAAHPEFQVIQYARLTVTDTGHGMDAKTLARIFEPFFTTKPVGVDWAAESTGYGGRKQQDPEPVLWSIGEVDDGEHVMILTSILVPINSSSRIFFPQLKFLGFDRMQRSIQQLGHFTVREGANQF